jgi:hypothetical protein
VADFKHQRLGLAPRAVDVHWCRRGRRLRPRAVGGVVARKGGRVSTRCGNHCLPGKGFSGLANGEDSGCNVYA